MLFLTYFVIAGRSGILFLLQGGVKTFGRKIPHNNSRQGLSSFPLNTSGGLNALDGLNVENAGDLNYFVPIFNKIRAQLRF